MKTKLHLCFSIFFLSASLAFGQWIQMGEDINGEAVNDHSGWSVSLSSDGNTVAIGAHGNDDNGVNSGQVRVYEYNGAAWSQIGSDIDGEAVGDLSGISVSLSNDGTIVAIGANHNNGGGYLSGHVRVYQWDGISWSQMGSDVDGKGGHDHLGDSVSLNSDGSIVAIGAAGNGNDEDDSYTSIYQWDGISWNQLGNDLYGEALSDMSGWSVSLSSDGSIVAIGAIHNDGSAVGSGHVRIYQWDGISWNQMGSDIDGESWGDQSGWSVSLSSDGTIVAIGAFRNHDNGLFSGHVRIYQWDGISWNQLGQDIDGEAAADFSGRSVSLSSDGTIVAIGADGNDDNGNYSGHVRIYQWDGISWNQLGQDMDGEAAEDRSGYSISLSNNGGIVAIGAYYNDGNGSNSGHVRVYTNPFLVYTTIPDPNFEQALIDQGIDSEGTLDGQVLTADIASITSLDVSNWHILDLTGIENFTALETLNCSDNGVSSLNLSNNHNLVSLACSNNQLNILLVSSVGALAALDCSNNLFESLDLSYLPLLNKMDATQNPLLSCIQIADEVAANTGTGIYTHWLADALIRYSENCEEGMAKGTDDPTVKGTDKTTVRNEENTTAEQLKLYPNPASNRLYITLPPETALGEVAIYDMQGQRVITAKTTTIPVTHLPKGVYFAEIRLSNNERIVRKVIVSRE